MASQQSPRLRRAGTRARAAALLFSVLMLALSGCADGDLFNPNRNPSTQLMLRPVFAVNGNASAMVDVNQVRVTIRLLPGGEVVDQKVIPVDPAATSYNLDLEVPANSQLRILIELLNTVGGVTTVQFSGEIEMSVGTGPQSGPPADIPVFPGGPENLRITGLSVAPRSHSMLEGETFRFQANVTGGPSNPTVTWISLNSSVATVGADGTVTAVGPGSAVITAQAGPRLDNVTVEVGARVSSVLVSPVAPVVTSFGTDVTFTARVVDVRNNDVPGFGVEWSIADPTIATQVGPGVFRARRNGTTTITATATQFGRTVTGTTTLKVEQRPVTLVLDPPSATFNAFGATRTFTAQGKDAGGNPVDGLVFTWTSSDPAVATVDANGLVTARANGVTTIRASGGGAFVEGTVTVAQTAAELVVSPSEHTLESIGETVQLTAELRDARGNVISAPVTWSSTLPGIAAVNENGVVTATGNGTVVVIARAAGSQGSATITVQQVQRGVLIDPAAFELNTGSTITLRAFATDARGTPIHGMPVSWSSSNPAVATVNSAGVVTGVHAGEVDIVASSGGLSAGAHGVIVGENLPGGPFQLLIVSNRSSDNTFIQNNLTELMPHVTITTTTDPSQLTPSFLSQFKVVLLFENGLWGGATAAGNAIANYVLSGGNVVLGTFYWQDRSDNPYYNTSTNGWGALENLDMFRAPPGMGSSEFFSKFEYRDATLDPASIVTHPLTAGITTANIDSYPNGMDAKPGTTVVARYTNGSPLIGFVEHSLGQRLVGITFWPAIERQTSSNGDIWRMWTNALDWAAAGGTPAPVSSSSRVAAPRTQAAPRVRTAPMNAGEVTPRRGGSDGIR